MATNEHTSPRVASLAALLMHHHDPNVRSVAGSDLTQARDRHPKGSLGAHAFRNRLAGPLSVDEILAQYGPSPVLATLTEVLRRAYSPTAYVHLDTCWHRDDLDAVDVWRAEQPDNPDREEAIKRLVRRGLQTR